MGTFDKDLFDMGLARRKATLGEATCSEASTTQMISPVLSKRR
jgi:hypothetical protein